MSVTVSLLPKLCADRRRRNIRGDLHHGLSRGSTELLREPLDPTDRERGLGRILFIAEARGRLTELRHFFGFERTIFLG